MADEEQQVTGVVFGKKYEEILIDTLTHQHT